MSTTVTLDSAGRVVIPKALRDELCLEAGDALELTLEGENVTLRPVRSASPLQKEQGVWVFRSGQKLTVADVNKGLQDIRARRDHRNSEQGE